MCCFMQSFCLFYEGNYFINSTHTTDIYLYINLGTCNHEINRTRQRCMLGDDITSGCRVPGRTGRPWPCRSLPIYPRPPQPSAWSQYPYCCSPHYSANKCTECESTNLWCKGGGLNRHKIWLFLTISVLQACCAVTTEYGIPSNFVRKSTASFQIKISTAQLIFSNRNVIIFWK